MLETIWLMLRLTPMSIEYIHPSELPPLIAAGHTLIDVRTPAEYRAEYLTGSKLMPLDQIDAASVYRQSRPGDPIYILCQSGNRAEIAAKKLENAGCKSIYIVEGGLSAAKAAGVDIQQGQHAVSLERQVRIAAGAFVVLGTVMGSVIHPGYLAIPAFVGAGLIFAGITDSCGLAMLLARMPWNR
jgi:rhodanese-related sulfurtransferase